MRVSTKYTLHEITNKQKTMGRRNRLNSWGYLNKLRVKASGCNSVLIKGLFL